jgi:hypothetical protein
LVLVESKAIESAMVRSGNRLKEWNDGPPDLSAIKRLSDAFQEERKKLQEMLEELGRKSETPQVETLSQGN